MKDINWGTQDKVERILGRVGNRYAQHTVYHQKGMGDLENQLIRLRSVAHDDIADCVGMLPEMLAYAPLQSKEKPKEDVFRFLQKQTASYRGRSLRTSQYMFGHKRQDSVVEAKVGLVATEKGIGF